LPHTLPAGVRAFLRDHVESYEQLELLFLLRQEHAREWTAVQFAERTGLPADEIDTALAALQRAGCVGERATGTGAVRYAPCDARLAATIDELALANEQNRLAIIKLMSANAIERVRNATQEFADAFVIGRKKDG
jgi:DNA-binding IclR family transcriptional regulator